MNEADGGSERRIEPPVLDAGQLGRDRFVTEERADALLSRRNPCGSFVGREHRRRRPAAVGRDGVLDQLAAFRTVGWQHQPTVGQRRPRNERREVGPRR